MASTDAALWQRRLLRFAIGGGTPVIGGVLGVLRNKWLALHLETAGLGVLAQVISGQIWLGTVTGLGLGVPVARAVGAAVAGRDRDAARRVAGTALAMIGATGVVTVVLGLAAAPWISRALLGSEAHAGLVRISMLGVAGLAVHGLVQGVMAGRSDVRAALTLALAGGTVALAVTLALVPRLGLAGGALGAAVLFPAGVAGALWFHRRDYRGTLVGARPTFDRATARGLAGVAGAALAMALVDQGTLMALRAHYLRGSGIPANGLLQAALSLSQQLGGLFYAYLASHAFGRISGAAGIEGVRAYTRRLWTPLVVAAALAFGVAMLAATPVLHLFFSDRFADARPMLAWTMTGEFAKVAVQVWALGALPLGGVRLWLPIGLGNAAALAGAYAVLVRVAPGELSLPLAYAVGAIASLGFTAVWMSRRGVTLGFGGAVALLASLAGLVALAARIARGA